MTDQNIPEDKVREVRDLHRDAAKMATITDAEREIHRHVADAMEALLPAPALPTLEDMAWEERAASRWMQADSEKWGRVVITDPCPNGGRAGLLSQRGNTVYADHSAVTPLPDLPRMEWPGEQKPSPALPDGWRLADHPEHGRVIVTRATPDHEGYVYFVYPNDVVPVGYGWNLCYPADLTFLDTDQ